MAEQIKGLANEIKEAYSARRTNALNFGRAVHKVRTQLKRGQFSAMAKSGALPLAKRTLEEWALIGKELGGLDANDGSQLATDPCSETCANHRSQISTNNSSQLPAAWKPLYWLARLGRELVLKLIRETAIRPDLKEKEARALFNKFKPQYSDKPRRWSIGRRLAAIEDFVELIEYEGTWRERESVASTLDECSARLRPRASLDRNLHPKLSTCNFAPEPLTTEH